MLTCALAVFLSGSDPLAAKLDYQTESCGFSSELSAMVCVVQVTETRRYRLELRDSSKMDPKTHWHVVLAKYDVPTGDGEELMGFPQMQYFPDALAPDVFSLPMTIVKGAAMKPAGPRRELLLLVQRKGDALAVTEGWKSPACDGECTIEFSKRTSAPPKKEVTLHADLRGGKPAKGFVLVWDGGKLREK